ncbi:MAG: hypothetical protein IKO20_01620 [Bacteroidaceae bacterium]|nr:hypothetical protein [Bacteroidaceae bacterium]
MATTTAKSATRAAENKNAAANAASVQTKSAAAESTTRRSRIIVAGIPSPTEKATHVATATPTPTEKPDTVNSAATVQAAAPQQAAAAPKPELTAEQKAAQLQAEIERKTKALQAALTELAHKKELNDHRTRFLKTLDQLQAAEDQLNETDDFEAPSSKICFETKPDGYRWDTAFSIGNVELQKEFIQFIRAKIRAKVEQIEAELIK